MASNVQPMSADAPTSDPNKDDPINDDLVRADLLDEYDINRDQYMHTSSGKHRSKREADIHHNLTFGSTDRKMVDNMCNNEHRNREVKVTSDTKVKDNAKDGITGDNQS